MAPGLLKQSKNDFQWENFCFLFKNTATIYFTLHRLMVYLLDTDNNQKLEFQDLKKAWNDGGFVKSFIIGLLVVLGLFVGGVIALIISNWPEIQSDSKRLNDFL